MSARTPEDVWTFSYEGFDPDEEGLREALCALGNGYFVTRAAAPEAAADDVHYPGTYLAGCYNRRVTEVQGRPIENEDLVNLPNWLLQTFRIGDGDAFRLSNVTVEDYRLRLDMRHGILTRSMSITDAEGRRTDLSERRLVHMGDKNLAALETTIVARNWSGPMTVVSGLDGTVTNAGVPRYRELDGRHLAPLVTSREGDDRILLVVETNQSHVRIAEAARVRLSRGGQRYEAAPQVDERPGYIALEIPCEVEQDVPVTVEKTVVVSSSRERALSEPGYAALRKLERAAAFEDLVATQTAAWDELWRRAALDLNGGDEANRILLLHTFQTLQTVSPNSVDLDAGVGPRGLHGEAYRGHVFWDEMYIFPLLNRTFPHLTREMLLYRYRRLPEARRLAADEGLRGALFPWQSGSDGREETQVLHLNPKSGRWLPDVSHLQRHVNAAIAYNVWQYWEATRDLDFLGAHGAEILLEIARFFASLATYDDALDRYEICGVMGPDEYHTGYPWREDPGLDNNAYTNVMAVWLLSRALDVLQVLPALRRDELLTALAITGEELDLWKRITRKMRIVFHDGTISQFEHYDRLEEFDWEGYAARHGNIQRLDRILESEDDTPDRYRVAKQADTLMLFYLLPLGELRRLFAGLGYELDDELVTRTIRYYAERTAHGSTLSAIVHAWVLGHIDSGQSWEFFEEALRSDVEDTQGGTTREGIHLGTMAGTVDLVQRAYLGLEIRNDALCFDPDLPAGLQSLGYTLLLRGHRVALELSGDELAVALDQSAPGALTVRMKEAAATLQPGARLTFELERRA